jgi:hypothetical protein
MMTEVVFGVVYLICVALSLVSHRQLNQFLARTPEIADEPCLERYKALARVQMYMALAVTLLLVIGLVAGIMLISQHGLGGLAAVVLANVLVFAFGLYHRRVETRVRGLSVRSETLAAEYARVSQSWVKKALPDF